VDALREDGWSVRAACRLVRLSRSGYDATRHESPPPAAVPNPSDAALLARIRPITTAHPFWGYRRVWAWLRYRERLRANTKRVYRLMREAGLTVKRARHAATRTTKAKPKATRPRYSWGIDMTKCLLPHAGLGLLCGDRPGLVHQADRRLGSGPPQLPAGSGRWPWARWCRPNSRTGVREAGLKLVSDNGELTHSDWVHGGHEPLGNRAGLHQLRQPEGQCGD
jgi:hypothetical protein